MGSGAHDGYLPRIEELPAWLPVRNHLRRLASAPVHQLADPALAARLLETDTDALLAGRGSSHGVDRDSSLLGALFESLVTLSQRARVRSTSGY